MFEPKTMKPTMKVVKVILKDRRFVSINSDPLLVSPYIPRIIKSLINSIRADNKYVLCPYYAAGDVQIGITETGKTGEKDVDTITRGVNEETGLFLTSTTLDKRLREDTKNNKKWTGVICGAEECTYSPRTLYNGSTDDKNKKAAIIVLGTLDQFETLFEPATVGDVDSDNITGFTLISVKDCKLAFKL